MESINILNSDSKINKIEYKRIQKNNSKKNFEIVVKDSFKITNFDESELKIDITREVGFTPSGIFLISINGEVIIKYEKSIEGLVIDETYITNNIRDIVVEADLMSYISAIISNISTFSGQLPIITPPVLII